MNPKTAQSKRVLVCIPSELLKKVAVLQRKYKNRSEMIRIALELLWLSHGRKSLAKELERGFKVLKDLDLVKKIYLKGW